MKRILLLSVFLFSFVQAQEEAPSGTTPSNDYPPPLSTTQPAIRPKPPQDPNPESSSFFGEPENLDPLRARQDSVKDDDEPVLEDIRSVLEAPPQKKKSAAKAPTTKGKSRSAKARKKVQPQNQNLNPDDPDSELEKKLYRDFLRYSAEPTSEEGWSAAVAGRDAEVYIVQKGDTLWTISETLFGDSLFWPKIWAINRQGILNPHFITPGMKVRFYPGSDDDAPTLAVGEEFRDEDSGPEDGVIGQGGDEVDLDEGEDASFDEDETGDSAALADAKDAKRDDGKSFKIKSKKPSQLPPSLPVYRSDLYFNKPREVIVDEIEPLPVFKRKPTTDLIVTDRLVVSDIKLKGETEKLVHSCTPGEMIREFSFVRRQPTTEYEGLSRLTEFKYNKDTTLYVYKRVTKLMYTEPDRLRIVDCRAPINEEMVFVPSNLVSGLKAKVTNSDEPSVVGYPENVIIGLPDSVALINLGATPYNIGDKFFVNSSRYDILSARVSVLDQYGSFALGYIDRFNKPIEQGDKIIK